MEITKYSNQFIIAKKKKNFKSIEKSQISNKENAQLRTHFYILTSRGPA